MRILIMQEQLLRHWSVSPVEGVRVSLIAYGPEPALRGRVSQQAMFYQLPGSDFRDVPEPDNPVAQDDEIRIAGEAFQVKFTPGHAPDHISLYCSCEGFRQADFLAGSGSGTTEWQEHWAPLLIAGDALFRGSVGRTDLPGASPQQLASSIQEQLYTLPDTTVVMPGHGPDTTIGFEKHSNPFVRATS